jgi:threonine dehydratase
VDTVIVPVGGGGLISGISTAVHGIKPEVRIIGVEAEAAPGAHTSLRDGGPRTVDISPSLADGLLGTLTDRTYRIVRRQVERVELVTESEIEDALYLLQQSDRIMAEGSAVVGLAALLAGRIELPAGSSCVLVLTGRNVSAGTYNAALRRAERRV